MKKMPSKGFTLLEFLLFMTLFAFLLSLGTVSFLKIWQADQLSGYSFNVVSSLKRTQIQTLAGKNDQNHGVYFASDKFVLFSGLNYNPSDSKNIEYPLPSVLTFSEINLPENSVVFAKLTGRILNFDSSHRTLVLKETETGRQKTVSFSAIGTTEVF